ncbi:hypothetical protein GXP71_08495 [Cellulomonas sp. H30R-01]|uniref:alpha amylase C-terminal domain-containing protein n=1 Tax=Cellulomonas sp. H30R-01 TaxID=2704467 RepID=UPI00138DAD29|nr:alpha amylase C-terminal domain-containing protein [Cellulomonas sp. H30R-01]QHT56112.1 hypothetical protein GXP71_08495 [Cellulomonas sp. H30R-01]
MTKACCNTLQPARRFGPADVHCCPLPAGTGIVQEVLRGAGEPVTPEQGLGTGPFLELASAEGLAGALGGGSPSVALDLGTYGIPLVHSGYAFSDRDAGPPQGDAVALGRGDRGLVVVNAGDGPLEAALVTRLADGDYCDVLTDTPDDCAATRVEHGQMTVDVPPRTARAWLVGRTA